MFVTVFRRVREHKLLLKNYQLLYFGMEEEVVWSVKENASLYDALHLGDKNNPQQWDANAEVTRFFVEPIISYDHDDDYYYHGIY